MEEFQPDQIDANEVTVIFLNHSDNILKLSLDSKSEFCFNP